MVYDAQTHSIDGIEASAIATAAFIADIYTTMIATMAWLSRRPPVISRGRVVTWSVQAQQVVGGGVRALSSAAEVINDHVARHVKAKRRVSVSMSRAE